MDLKEYFESTEGFGVLTTADGEGNVNSAVYARPHMMEDGSLAFIMRDRRSYKNLKSNPNAMYIFKADGPGYKGKRLYLTKIREEENSPLIDSLSRRPYPGVTNKEESKFLVYFKLERERPLIGGYYL
jgi:hypothetical protein